VLEGYALHSGVYASVRLFRDEGPLRFRRGRTVIPAALDYVVDTKRTTTLGRGGVRVALVEHLLAALAITGFYHGVVIEVSAEELPILDGSALPFLAAITSLGDAPAPPEPFRLKRPAEYLQGATRICALPGEAQLQVEVDFPHPAIGRQCWRGAPERYCELLPARTFGFLHEADALRKAGLASHVTLENAIVFNDVTSLTPLRFPDEVVRHKALDALGDFCLLGRPLGAHLVVQRGSHHSHLAFLYQLRHGALAP
jgi:UDP-3-O-acyl-N-acetylglucosamine deacetylase